MRPNFTHYQLFLRRACREHRLVKTDTILMQGQLPFAVVGSTDEVKLGNKIVRARQYPWGIVQGRYIFLEIS